MRRILFITMFTILTSYSLYSQQYWLNVPSPVSKSLSKCFFLDTVRGWAAGDSGVIVHTSNSGANWISQNSGITVSTIDDIFFIDQNTGWALTNDYLFQGSIVLRTTNGGANWTNYRLTDTTKVFNVVYFLNSQTGFLTGYTGEIFKTTNAGANWAECIIDTSFCSFFYLFPKNKISFLNSNTGYACGGQIDIVGMVWKTTDAGLNWLSYCVAPEPLYDIKPINPSKIAAIGGDPDYGVSFVVSYNGGVTWNYREIGIYGTGKSLAYRTVSELWVPTDYSAKFALSLDSGSLIAPWLEIPTPNNIEVKAAHFVTPTYGWAFGSGGAILKYNTSIIGVIGNQFPVYSSLYQNYPNPFNPSTRIHYSLASSGFITLEIYNTIGELVDVPVHKYQDAGNYELLWDGSGFPSGVYFYNMTTKDSYESRKMLLVK